MSTAQSTQSPADIVKAALAKANEVPVKKKAAPVYKAANKTPGALFGGQAPAGYVGKSNSTGILPLHKAMAYAGGQLPSDSDGDVREAVELSNRIKSVYGAFFDFSNNPNSILVPASDPSNRFGGFLPTVSKNGVAIPGASEIRKEISQRVIAVKSLDPDELRAKALKGDSYAQNALNTLLDSAGGFTVAPPMLGDMIDLQRNLEVFSRAGANNVTLPPNGRIAFPKLTSGATAYWVGETASITESQETTGSLNLEAKKLAIRVPLTNEIMRFSDQSIDGMVRLDMAAQGGLAADLSMLQGTGGTQVKGLITYTTASEWTQGVDALLTYSLSASTFQPEDAAGMAAVLPDEVTPNSWVMRKQMWPKIWNRRADAVSVGDSKGPFVASRFNVTPPTNSGQSATLDGVNVIQSSQVSKTRGSGTQTYILLGYFPDWIVGRLGVLEFMVDPYTQMQNYQTVIQAVQFIDAGARHAASFVFADAVSIQ